jgi:hypothetical protein
MTSLERIKLIQAVLDVPVDGDWGSISQGALSKHIRLAEIEVTSDVDGWNVVKASSFADPADIRAFDKCKLTGKSDQECFKVGDNGIGKWGKSTKQGTGPCVALPPEEWGIFADPDKQKVVVEYKGKQVICDLRDTMPSYKNIRNGAGIDLNPDACKALGFTPPILVSGVKWRWA